MATVSAVVALLTIAPVDGRQARRLPRGCESARVDPLFNGRDLDGLVPKIKGYASGGKLSGHVPR